MSKQNHNKRRKSFFLSWEKYILELSCRWEKCPFICKKPFTLFDKQRSVWDFRSSAFVPTFIFLSFMVLVLSPNLRVSIGHLRHSTVLKSHKDSYTMLLTLLQFHSAAWWSICGTNKKACFRKSKSFYPRKLRFWEISSTIFKY